MKIFYIADWHYDHANVIHFDNRPFNTVEEMNAQLVENWNNTVTDDDIVYVLGDMFWCGVQKATPIMNSLHGTKVLVQGNHDSCRCKEFMKLFADYVPYLEIVDGCNNVVLCHYPMPCFKNHYWNWVHLYGHVHNSFEANMMEKDKDLMITLYGKKCQMFNVGCMMPWMNYTPKTLADIMSGYNLYQIQSGKLHVSEITTPKPITP